MKRLVVLMLLVAALTGGCADGGGSGSGLAVTATTTQVGDLVRNVGGDRVHVTTILRPGADPHEFEPRPSDAKALSSSRVVFRSGGEIDDWLDDLIGAAGGGARVVTLTDSVRRIEGDPHWWQDPRNAELAVTAIRDALIKADAGGEATYRRRAAAYEHRLRTLDSGIGRCMAEVPPAKRKLVTTHDSLSYFARRYGVEVVGAVIRRAPPRRSPPGGHRAARQPGAQGGGRGDLPRERAQPATRARAGARGRGERGGEAVGRLPRQARKRRRHLPEGDGLRDRGDGQRDDRRRAPLHSGHFPVSVTSCPSIA